MKKLFIFGLMCALLVSLAQAISLTVDPTTATPEDQTITVTLSTDVSATFSKNSSQGSFSTTGPATVTNFTFSPGHDSSNVNRVFSFLFIARDASDSTKNDSKVATLTFTNVNRAPSANAGSDLNAARNTTVSITGSANDPDGDTLTFLWEEVSTPSDNWGLVYSTTQPTAQFIGYDVGNYTFRMIVSDGAATAADTMSIQVNNPLRLRLKDLDFKVGSEDDKNMENSGDGTSISSAQPGDRLTVDAEVENAYPDDSDIEIRDVSMTVTVESIDDGDDLDDETNEEDIQAGRNKNFKLSFDIPKRVDTDDYDIIIEIEGRDENGITHRIVKRFTMGIDKDSHDLQIGSAQMRPSVLSCTRTGTMDIMVVNYGDEDETEVRVTATSDDLNLDYEAFDDGNIDMGTGFDDDADLLLTVPVGATDLPVGSYPVSISVYRDTDRLEDTMTTEVLVQNCVAPSSGAGEPETPEEPEEVVVVTPPSQQGGTGTAPVYAQVDTGFTGSNMYLVLLGAGAVVLLVIVIGILVMLFK